MRVGWVTICPEFGLTGISLDAIVCLPFPMTPARIRPPDANGLPFEGYGVMLDFGDRIPFEECLQPSMPFFMKSQNGSFST